MNKFIAFAFLAFCGVATSQVIPVGSLGPVGPLGLPMSVYQSDLITSQLGSGSSSSAAAAAAASSSSAANNDIIATRMNALNAWPLGLGSLGPVGLGHLGLGPIGPIGSVVPIGQQGSSSSSAAAAAAAASSSAANNAILNNWPVVSGINPWLGPVGPVGPGLVQIA